MGSLESSARWFDQAIQLGLPRGRREVAYVGLAEMRAASGDLAGARRAAAAYLARFENGAHVEAMRSWASGDVDVSALEREGGE